MMASRDPIAKIQRKVSNYKTQKKPRTARYIPYTMPVVIGDDYADMKYGAWGGKLNPWNWFAGAKKNEEEDYYDQDYYSGGDGMSSDYSFDKNFEIPVGPKDRVQGIFDPVKRASSKGKQKKEKKPITIF